MLKVEQNISRLKYLLDLYRITVEEFLAKISEGLKRPLTESDVFSEEIKVSHLKRIDKLFNKGLHFYLDPNDLHKTEDASVFFRKAHFNSDLNIGAKKVVDHFEEVKISLSAISKLAGFEIKRELPVFDVKEDVRDVATEIRSLLYTGFESELKDFLRSLIVRFAEYNVMVFEFVETWNQKDKANIDGFFLRPNVIVLKRQQQSFRREIFTLIHELGHFLLDDEEIDELNYQSMANKNLPVVERWCNDFSFYFLAGDYASVIDSIEMANSTNDYCFDIIGEISNKTHLSKIALFTRLLFKDKISQPDYNKVKADFDQKFNEQQRELQRIKMLRKEQGIEQKGSTPKPILSPLLISTIQSAFYEGVLNEYEVCKHLNIRPERLEKYI
ncbi:MAG: ImmA/IrrE family metallo-endopeptidase [Chlorobiales bacterium]|nr:ImmA/IrrE family metallo-endopeptidase [Chlorobiales bacterium]